MSYKDPDKQRAYQRERYQRLRQEWLVANGPCVFCGSVQDLQVDHIDPSTKVSHRIWSWSLNRRLAELAKCRVLCQPCHIRKTVDSGEMARGEDNGNAVIPDVVVRSVIHDWNKGLTTRQLAAKHGLRMRHVQLIVYTKRRSHHGPPLPSEWFD